MAAVRKLLPKPTRTDDFLTKAYQIEGLEPFGVPLRRNTTIPMTRSMSKRNRRSR